jgi:hypothetical protein
MQQLPFSLEPILQVAAEPMPVVLEYLEGATSDGVQGLVHPIDNLIGAHQAQVRLVSRSLNSRRLLHVFLLPNLGA